MQESVLLRTPLVANTGYGHDGFALTRGFHELGLDVRLMPMMVLPPLPMGVAKTLVKPLDIDFDYVVHHTDPAQLGLTDAEQRVPGKKIAWSMWEFTRMAPEVAETLTKALSSYDMLLVYDEVSAEAFEPHAREAGIEMKILQGGFWAEDWEYDASQRDWTGPFRFVMAGQLHQRKNPFAAISAFNEVRKDFPNAELHLKTTVKTLHPAMEEAYPGLKIHYDMWPQEKLKDFYKGAHCYVAPSWGEGKNLPALECQSMGVPVIYSDFGGHRQWGSSEYGWPVTGTVDTHYESPLPSFRIDHDALVAAMREAISDPFKTRLKGEKAASVIPAMCDWKNVLQRFLAVTR